MTTLHPIRQAAVEDLRNALQIAESWSATYPLDAGVPHAEDAANAFSDVARLLRHALEELSEPNAAALRVTEALLHAAMGPIVVKYATTNSPRFVRDTASSIIHAQITGQSPETL